MAEHDHICLAVRFARKLHGSTPADQFGPLALKSVRQTMVDAGLARITVNQRIARVVRMFRWAAENEMLSAAIYQALETVEGLKKGRTAACESRNVRPVADAEVDACQPFVTPRVWAIVELLRLTEARAGEAVPIRTADLDRSSDVWIYRPRSHKTEGHGHERTIVLGPRAIEDYKPWLRDDPEAFLFQPRGAILEVRRWARKRRVTPLIRRSGQGGGSRTRSVSRATSTGSGRCTSRSGWLALPHPTLLGKPDQDLTDAERVELKAWRKAHRCGTCTSSATRWPPRSGRPPVWRRRRRSSATRRPRRPRLTPSGH